jgi:hypothetical protein
MMNGLPAARWDVSAELPDGNGASSRALAERALARRALRGVRCTGLPLTLSLIVANVALGLSVTGFIGFLVFVLFLVAFVVMGVLWLIRTRLVEPFVRSPAGPVRLRRPGWGPEVAATMFVTTLWVGSLAGHLGSTQQVPAVVTSCQYPGLDPPFCDGEWRYGGTTYTGQLPATGPVGSTQTIDIQPSQPGSPLPGGATWLADGTGLAACDVALGAGWVLMLRHRSRAIRASARQVLAVASG